MKNLKVIRQSLGFCQQEMAETLSVTRSMIVRAETEDRDLNFVGCKQFMELDTCIKESERLEGLTFKENNEANLIKAFQHQLEKNYHKTDPLRQKLEKMETDYIKHQTALKVVEQMGLRNELFDPGLLAKLKYNIKNKLAKCSFLARALLKAKIQGLEGEKRYVLEQIEKIEGKTEVIEPVIGDQNLKVKTEKGKMEINYENVYKIGTPVITHKGLTINAIEEGHYLLSRTGSP